MVSSFEINGKSVDVEPDATSYTYTAVEGDKGFQVTSATFGSVENYGQTLVQDYYDSLALADDQLAVGFKAATEFPQEKAGYVAGAYADATVKGIATTYVGKVTTALADLDAKATVKDKVAAVKTVYAEAKTKIDAQYATVLGTAKTTATASASTLYNDGEATSKTDKFITADRTAILAAAKTAIASATTLAGISALIDATASKLGSYNVLEARRTASFNLVSTAAAAIYGPTGDTGFDPSVTSTYKALKAMLAKYGITTLPEDVASGYYTKISAATELTLVGGTGVDKDNTALGVEGRDAVKASYAAIQKTLKQAVLDAYYAEVESSEVITTTGDRENFKTAILNVVDNWMSGVGLDGATDAKITKKVSDMVSYVYTDANHGLLGTVEQYLATYNASFTTERLANARKSVIDSLTKEVSDIEAADADYKTAITKVSNAYPTTIGATGATVTNAIGGAASYDVEVELSTLVPASLTGGIYAKTTVAEIQTFGTDGLTAIDGIYEAALTKYSGDQKAARITGAVQVNSADSTIFTKAVLETAWDDQFVDAKGKALVPGDTLLFSTVSSVATTSLKWYTLLSALETNYTTWKTAAVAKDADLAAELVSGNDIYDSFTGKATSMSAKIFAGTVSTSAEVTAWSDTLAGMYTADVSTFLSNEQTYLGLVYNGKVANSPSAASALDKVYKAMVASIGTGVNVTYTGTHYSGTKTALTSGTAAKVALKCDTFTSINTWYDLAVGLLTAVAAGDTVTFGTYTA